MLDIVLFVPRLIWDIVLAVWGVVRFLWELFWSFASAFIPNNWSPNSWAVIVGAIVLFALAFITRDSLGGFFSALWKIIFCVGVAVVMFSLNPWGAGITIVVALLVGFDVLRSSRLLYMGLGLMWAVMLILKVMG